MCVLPDADYNLTLLFDVTVYCVYLCRSDVGPKVGFEATGLVNSKLPTVGVWARKSSEVSL